LPVTETTKCEKTAESTSASRAGIAIPGSAFGGASTLVVSCGEELCDDGTLSVDVGTLEGTDADGTTVRGVEVCLTSPLMSDAAGHSPVSAR
jgi:hypothetical protein